MTHDSRRLVDRDRSGGRDALSRQDLDGQLVILKGGRVTISVDALRRALGLEALAAAAAAAATPAEAEEVPVFEGAGADGLVPDPVAETGLYLKDDGTWSAPSGSGAPTTAPYVMIGNDAAFSAERSLVGSSSVAVTDGGANSTATLSVPTEGITRGMLVNGLGNSVIGRASNTIGPVADIVAGSASQVLRASAGGAVIGFGQIATLGIEDDAVDNTKAANMLSSRIKGRVTAATGDPEDLTAAQVRTLINVADGANAYVHPNHTGDVTSVADGAQTIAADAVTYAKMQNISAISKLLGRGDSGAPGDPQEITLGTNLSMSGTTLNAAGGGGAVPTGTGFRHVTAGVEDAASKLVDTADVNNDQITYAKIQNVSASGRLLGRITAGAGDIEEIPLAGTVFPTSPTPVDGQMFYRTDHRTAYVYNATTSVWLSIQVHEVPYGQTGATATNGFFKIGGSNGSALFSANFGHLFGFPVAIVGITWRSVGPATGTVAVFANNVAVASATMTLAADTSKTREDFLPAAGVASGQTIQVKNTGAATAATSAQGVIRFRRRET